MESIHVDFWTPRNKLPLKARAIYRVGCLPWNPRNNPWTPRNNCRDHRRGPLGTAAHLRLGSIRFDLIRPHLLRPTRTSGPDPAQRRRFDCCFVLYFYCCYVYLSNYLYVFHFVLGKGPLSSGVGLDVDPVLPSTVSTTPASAGGGVMVARYALSSSSLSFSIDWWSMFSRERLC